MTARDDWLKIVEMRDDGSLPIPCRGAISLGSWLEHGEALGEVVDRYPKIFGKQKPVEDWAELEERRVVPEPYTDSWGCRWEHVHVGITGQVTDHPLADWDAVDDYQPPDPMLDGSGEPIDWDEVRGGIVATREKGQVAWYGFEHGYFFMRLYYVRGFEDLMMDMATASERVDRLCEMIVDFYSRQLEQVLPARPDLVSFADDLGMQHALTISPPMWRRFIKPGYAKLFRMCRDAGAHVGLHSDGYWVEIMDDLVACGVTIENPQDLCNGLENIRSHLKGKVCIDLDIDRQAVLPFGTPAHIDEHIRTFTEALGSPQGGLMMIWGIYEGTPVANIEACAAAMTKYRGMFCGG